MRKTFVDANNQHRPEDAWLVIGEPSRAILILNFCVSEIATEREDRTALAELELRAARARRFFIFCQHTLNVYTILSYLWVFHELLLPFLNSSSRDVLLVLCDGCVFRCCWTIRKVCLLFYSIFLRASPPTTIKPSFSLTVRSCFIWSACSRSTSFSLTAASEGLDWLAPILEVVENLHVESRYVISYENEHIT
jgi:hypothetical protein